MRKFKPGDYFKVISNGKSGRITGVKLTAKVGHPVLPTYRVIWAHSEKKNTCNYGADLADKIWEPATQDYFESRPIEKPTPSTKKGTVGNGEYLITVPVGFTIDPSKVPDPNEVRWKRAGETLTFKVADDVLVKALGGACDHSFTQYIGFRESYEFCTKCDHKKDIPK